jgi:hypothetical protein
MGVGGTTSTFHLSYLRSWILGTKYWLLLLRVIKAKKSFWRAVFICSVILVLSHAGCQYLLILTWCMSLHSASVIERLHYLRRCTFKKQVISIMLTCRLIAWLLSLHLLIHEIEHGFYVALLNIGYLDASQLTFTVG